MDFRCGLLILVIAGCVCAAPAIADPDAALGSEYRLRVAPEAFRLKLPDTRGETAPKVPEISTRLVDQPYARLIQSAAHSAALDPALVHAVIYVESRYNPAARSPKGAIGLMQVMPNTASRYGVRDAATSPEANLKAGTLYLKDLMRQFGDRLELVLAAYNAGEDTVVRYGERIPPYAETQAYVPAVLAKYLEWREPPPPLAPPRIEYVPGTLLGLKPVTSVVE